MLITIIPNVKTTNLKDVEQLVKSLVDALISNEVIVDLGSLEHFIVHHSMQLQLRPEMIKDWANIVYGRKELK